MLLLIMNVHWRKIMRTFAVIRLLDMGVVLYVRHVRTCTSRALEYPMRTCVSVLTMRPACIRDSMLVASLACSARGLVAPACMGPCCYRARKGACS